MSCIAKTIFVMVALIFVFCEAQVNFTPNWGKRSGLQDAPCKASTEAAMYIYKLIQNEAQKLLDCEKFGSN
ncbi:Hypertrehalosaemic prohormone [Zootermopsis nevadensis]|uniref:AKH preprohormone-like protein n=1 Tax=Zootermopsis nevadensis TaxID=136037 RepID=A0A067RJ06_ZOONE|nr:AKH preprohormone-like protein [Zootermopsis nevadensis]KDR23008.1 Hypertrehalosaemic prohormone [Zootermopsis nevadensis]